MDRIVKGAVGPFLLLCGALLCAAPSISYAQSGDAIWNATLAKAKTQTLVMVNQGGPGFDKTIEAFTKKFGIKVEATVARPTVILPRVKTEQANGQYVWDLWWATTSNMTGTAGPAGMLQKFEDFLILPEVKDVSQWRHPDYIYGDAARMVFTHAHEVTASAYRNVEIVPDLNTDSIDGLLDPRLKGRIIVRDASQPNAGSSALAPLYKVKGEAFVTRFLKDQDPRVLDNPQQIDSTMMRGGAAVAFGMQFFAYAQCVKDGGCKNIKPIPKLEAVSSRGFSVFKNAPNPEATKIFVNWVLSKEGQELFVKEWAAANESGAVSMRKDVEPHPSHTRDLPDFAKANDYVWVHTNEGAKEVDAVVRIFKQVADK
jgi:ABC-type Fe3+ transport system substrate-binding protein